MIAPRVSRIFAFSKLLWRINAFYELAKYQSSMESLYENLRDYQKNDKNLELLKSVILI